MQQQQKKKSACALTSLWSLHFAEIVVCIWGVSGDAKKMCVPMESGSCLKCLTDFCSAFPPCPL